LTVLLITGETSSATPALNAIAPGRRAVRVHRGAVTREGAAAPRSTDRVVWVDARNARTRWSALGISCVLLVAGVVFGAALAAKAVPPGRTAVHRGAAAREGTAAPPRRDRVIWLDAGNARARWSALGISVVLLIASVVLGAALAAKAVIPSCTAPCLCTPEGARPRSGCRADNERQ